MSTDTLPNTLYFFQFNLVGLSTKVHPMKKGDHEYSKKTATYYDKEGEIGGDAIPISNKKWPIVFNSNYGRTAYYFKDKKQAEMVHKILCSYRKHITQVI